MKRLSASRTGAIIRTKLLKAMSAWYKITNITAGKISRKSWNLGVSASLSREYTRDSQLRCTEQRPTPAKLPTAAENR
ncbi:MAG: hypothetical protein LBK73_04950 [Treponema sp.]|nr:hypothetical protein [Treponema sp.]